MSLEFRPSGESSSQKRLTGQEGNQPPLLGRSAGFHSLGTQRDRKKVPVANANAHVCCNTLRNLKLLALPLSKLTAAVIESVSMMNLLPKLLVLRSACLIAYWLALAS